MIKKYNLYASDSPGWFFIITDRIPACGDRRDRRQKWQCITWFIYEKKLYPIDATFVSINDIPISSFDE